MFCQRQMYSPAWKWNRGWSILLATLLLLALILPGWTFPQRGSPPVLVQPQLLEQANQQPDAMVRVIVQKLGTGSGLEETIKHLEGKIISDLSIINAFTVELPAKNAVELGRSPQVRWVSLDGPVTTSGEYGCCDTNALTNTYNKVVGATKVWNNQNGWGMVQPWLQGQGIGVAVVDSGIVRNSDFTDSSGYFSRIKYNVKLKSSNFVGTDDLYGHGSLVAGIIGGNGNASQGAYVGIAPQVNLYNVKVSDEQGEATTTDLINGLQWIKNNKDTYNIRVVNISLNSSVQQSYNVDPLCAAAEILWFSGIVVVVSAGNDGNGGLYPPANDPFVITVGATDHAGTTSIADDTVASFSAYGTDETGGTKPDLVAPGRNLVSVLASTNSALAQQHGANVVSSNPQYFRASGTSFSAPIVSGAVALLLQTQPWLNPDQVKYRLKATALRNISRGSWDTRSLWAGYNTTKAGAGYLDIYAAITQTGINGTANTGLPASQMLWTGSTPVSWSSVNWSSVNWSSVNWSSVNWSSVNWSSVNWSSDYWG